jgi:hypothetical protein
MNEKTQVTQAERDNWWEERMSQPYPRAKPKPKPQITAEVSPQTAEAVKANPQSLRLSAHSADGVTVIDRPRLFSVLEVLEVDAQGRPPLGRSYDPATNSYAFVRYAAGYQRDGLERDYNPIARFEEGFRS